MPLTGFDIEGIGKLTKNARNRLEWLLNELRTEHPRTKPINSHAINFKAACDENGHLKNRGLRGIEIRSMIHLLRNEGYPIGSNSKGYFWASKPEELDDTIEHLKQRSNSIQETIKSLQEIKASMWDSNQTKLF